MTVEDVLKDYFWNLIKTQAALQVEVERLKRFEPKPDSVTPPGA
jgi:hypothetical protein